MQSIKQKISVTIHIYGHRVRRGYIQIYHPHNKTIQRLYRPFIQKKILAIRTLALYLILGPKIFYYSVMQADEPDFVEKESKLALKDKSQK